MPDYNNAVAVTRDIHWVGFYDAEAKLHCNPYLIIDEHDIVFIDPGSIPHFPQIMRKVIDLINPNDINYIITSHQDPDVCGNIPVVEDVINREDLKIITTKRTARLIRHYGTNSQLYIAEEHDNELSLRSGRLLKFISTPYLHAPGAMATYDMKTNSLFTSDLFGGISINWDLFAQNDFITPMKYWHQEYMPSNEILTNCLEQIELLSPDRILPQHGSILEGKQIRQAIDFLKSLPCGLDCVKEPAYE